MDQTLKATDFTRVKKVIKWLLKKLTELNILI